MIFLQRLVGFYRLTVMVSRPSEGETMTSKFQTEDCSNFFLKFLFPLEFSVHVATNGAQLQQGSTPVDLAVKGLGLNLLASREVQKNVGRHIFGGLLHLTTI